LVERILTNIAAFARAPKRTNAEKALQAAQEEHEVFLTVCERPAAAEMDEFEKREYAALRAEREDWQARKARGIARHEGEDDRAYVESLFLRTEQAPHEAGELGAQLHAIGDPPKWNKFNEQTLANLDGFEASVLLEMHGLYWAAIRREPGAKFTHAALARRVGVSRATLYRRISRKRLRELRAAVINIRDAAMFELRFQEHGRWAGLKKKPKAP
jgi:hypothetical protein